MAGLRRVAIYGRVSADWQTSDSEIASLREVAERRNWKIEETYIDDAIKSFTSRHKRPAFESLRKDTRAGRFDTILMWSIGHISDTLTGINRFIAEMHKLGIEQYYHQERIDTSNPTGQAMVQMCVAFSQIERDHKRQKQGGTITTRGERSRISPQTEWAICQAVASRTRSVLNIANEFHVPVSLVQRIKTQMSRSG
jgi:DNA invertase Pin-like site-specific DNA recombinase